MLHCVDGEVEKMAEKAVMLAAQVRAWTGPGGFIRELGPEVVLVGWAGEH